MILAVVPQNGLPGLQTAWQTTRMFICRRTVAIRFSNSASFLARSLALVSRFLASVMRTVKKGSRTFLNDQELIMEDIVKLCKKLLNVIAESEDLHHDYRVE